MNPAELVTRSAGGYVKICGLREPEHARVAASAGADLLGFIFAPARRRITPDAARACIEAAKAEAGDRRILAVGVFVNATAEEMNGVAEAARLDVIQLHGDEDPAILGEIERPVTKALRSEPGASADAVLASAARFVAVPNAPVAFLLDGYSPGSHGGVGVRADWSLAARMARVHPLSLAGGLDPANVAEAIAVARPLAVDVSSGVETNGVKDPEKIRAFIVAARMAFAGLTTTEVPVSAPGSSRR
jgi:phosphoribosylanthranilate isomerase